MNSTNILKSFPGSRIKWSKKKKLSPVDYKKYISTSFKSFTQAENLVLNKKSRLRFQFIFYILILIVLKSFFKWNFCKITF